GATPVADVYGEADLAHIDLTRTGSSRIGTGGMITKVEAARIATGAGIPVVRTDAANANDVLAGKQVGTRFHVTGKRRPTRLLWLAHATEGKGRIVVDAGAVRALRDRGASLLPAGVVGVHGDFVAGDPVDLVVEDGASGGSDAPSGHAESTIVARGIANYDSAEIPRLTGGPTKELSAELGPAYEREVMHRDDLVILDNGVETPET